VDLEPRYLELSERAAQVAASVASLAAHADEATAPVPEMVTALRASGLPGLVVPSAYGGSTDRVDSLAVTVVREQLMGVSAHLDELFCMQGIGSYAVTHGGSEAVKQEWLPKVANLDVLAALALTEPLAGSDLKAMTTTITQVGDELVVNGAKSTISNAGVAGFYSLLAREGDGYSMVLIPADAAGLTTRPSETIIAPHLMGDLDMVDVRVPVGNRLGAPGKGFALVFATLGTFRVSVAGAAVGLAQSALDVATEHCRARNQFGGPLIEIGAVGQHLARSWAELEAARVFTYHAAYKAGQDPKAHLDLSSMAKIVATETAGRVIDSCVQVMGRFGLTRDSVVERAYRAARPMRIYEGGTEVILDSLARRLAAGAR
jgi:acyl-CoA dehydrogenase